MPQVKRAPSKVTRAPRPTRSRDYLVWIDCEMTGLDPARHVLLEIATIVTDYDLKIVALGPDLVIKPKPAALAKIDPWSRRAHTESGLLDRVAREGVSLAEAERQTLNFVKRYCYVRTAPLCGNSVGHDKKFLFAHMRRLHDFLNYRIIDVSSVKLLAAHWYGGRFAPPAKQNTHRALADIQESIAELAYYRKTVFVP